VFAGEQWNKKKVYFWPEHGAENRRNEIAGAQDFPPRFSHHFSHDSCEYFLSLRL